VQLARRADRRDSADDGARLGSFCAFVDGGVALVVQSFDPVVADEVIASPP